MVAGVDSVAHHHKLVYVWETLIWIFDIINVVFFLQHFHLLAHPILAHFSVA